MKTVRLSLIAALASLGLQACDINVKPEAASTPVATQQAQQPAAPVDATPTPVQSTEAPATPAVTGTTADSSAAGAPAAAPETAAMGAQPAAAPAVPDGVAAPTELAQFFEQNVIKPQVQ